MRANAPTAVGRSRLQELLTRANLPTLVMVLFQLSGEERWLQPPYRPTRGKGLDDHDDGGYPRQVQQAIRAAAADALAGWAEGAAPAVPAPRGEQLIALMSSCVGEPVPPEYEPMMAEEMGFALRPAAPGSTTGPPAGDFTVLIIGAGISGLAAAVELQRSGIRYTIVEADDGLGGTWLQNRYPGCGVDTPSYLYSYSYFSRDWSSHFAKRDELAEYLREFAHRFEIVPHIRYGTQVLGATYDDRTRVWRVATHSATEGHRTLTAGAVIACPGMFRPPKIPDLPGLDQFAGPLFHSAEWPDGLDPTGRRVAVVGTGASAMQIVPAVAGAARNLLVFQRSPQWVAPCARYFTPVGEGMHWLLNHVPFYQEWYRFRLAWTWNDRVIGSLRSDPAWSQASSVNAENDAHRRFFTRYLLEQLAGHDSLQRQCLPTYPPFGKRILLDNGWYAALKRPDVQLVDEAVTGFTAEGVRTASGAVHRADMVVLCTGFEAQRFMHPMEVVGRSGVRLDARWKQDDARAYLGIATPGFPNLFFMYGPNTNPGGGSFIFMAECQARYIAQLLSVLASGRASAVEVRGSVHEAFNAEVDAANAEMVWSHPSVSNYYKNASGRIVTNWPWRLVDYWSRTRTADVDDFAWEA